MNYECTEITEAHFQILHTVAVSINICPSSQTVKPPDQEKEYIICLYKKLRSFSQDTIATS